MGKTTMMREAKYRVLETSKCVDIRRFRRQSEGSSGERGLAIQSSPAQAGTGQEVSERFQSLQNLFLWTACKNTRA